MTLILLINIFIRKKDKYLSFILYPNTFYYLSKIFEAQNVTNTIIFIIK